LVPVIADLIVSYLAAGKDRIQIAHQNEWSRILVEFVHATFDGTRSSVMLENIDLSRIFEAITLLLSEHEADLIQALPALFQQVNRSRQHAGQFQELLASAAETGLCRVGDVARLLPERFPPHRVLELEFGQLTSGNFVSRVEAMLSLPKMTEGELFNALIREELRFRRILLDNGGYIIHRLAITNSEVVARLVRKMCAANADLVLTQMRAELAENASVGSVFLAVLVDTLSQVGFPRNAPLEGLDRLLPSPEVDALLAYFGDDHLVGQFQATFSAVQPHFSSDVVAKFVAMLPGLEACSDSVFRAVIELPLWTNLVTVLQCASTSAQPYIRRLIESILRRNLSPPPFVIDLIIGGPSNSPAALVTFLQYLPSLSLSAADMPKLTACVARLLPVAGEKDPSSALKLLLPPLTAFLRGASNMPDISIGDRQLVQAITVKSDISRELIDFSLACAAASPEFRTRLAATAKANSVSKLSFRAVPIQIVVLQSGLVLVEESDDSVIAERLFELFRPLQDQATDSIADEMYRFYGSHITEGSDILRGFAVPLTRALFRGAKLATLAERRFFEDAFARFPEEEVTAQISDICGALEPCTDARKRQALQAAKRATLLTVAWPSRKADIVAAVPTGICETFPTSHEWKGVVAALNPVRK
jgi:hypothetical protein